VRDGGWVATLRTRRTGTGCDGGSFLGANSELRAGYDIGYVDAGVRVGDPLLPSVDGREQAVGLRWTYDGQDHWIVPGGGTRVHGSVRLLFDSPAGTDDLRQAAFAVSHFTKPRDRDRLFLALEGSTSFSDRPSPFYQFTLGGPLRLSAFEVDQFRGEHAALLTTGYLRQIGRLPDFVGGPVYVAGWLESGSAFNDLDSADIRSSLSAGLIVETLLGPVVVGASVGDEGSAAFYFAIGRLFSQRPAVGGNGLRYSTLGAR